ncbi:Retrovirus-related Pol polyprotein from transposon TNT 1-94 [Sesamum angolense]|uniref:Retrovirus-related Pol polyprotein from transposon TNT 1-94 n=1 Tax=Sesamum angolense TaxID=2727404 RepID=A0AAE1T6T0_9LAMI|nr:Retrovirus-related Pol polyprotein from transposon TNT 1-94 [Sesamum angolense]
MKRLVDSNSLEIDNLDNLLVCESCLKGKMTRMPFVGQSMLTNGLLDLIQTDVYRPLNTLARGGFSYFIKFIDDHSRYGYVYLMRYKSEGFVRFKEFKLEENGIISQWTPLGTPQQNGVAEKRNRTLLDMIRSMISFIELPISFWGYAVETGSPTYVKRLVGDKLDSRSSLCWFIGYPKETARRLSLTISLRRDLYGSAGAIHGSRRRAEVIRGYDSVKNDFDPCVYKKVSGNSVVFLVLYVDDILLIGNDIKMLGDTKIWLSTQFSMKDLDEASYVLGIKIFRDRFKRILGMTQNSVKLSKKQSPKTDEELKRILDIPYTSAVGSIQYAAQCTRPDIAYAFSVMSRYQACAGETH